MKYQLPGHYDVSIREGTEKLLAFLKSTAFKDGIAVCVTHDVFLCVFVSTLTGYDFTETGQVSWTDVFYLEKKKHGTSGGEVRRQNYGVYMPVNRSR